MLGINKALALTSIVAEFAPGVHYTPMQRFYEEDDSIIASIVISALDSIDARKMVWKTLFNDSSKWRWYLDARMAAEHFQLYSVDHESDWDWYEKFIGNFDEEDVPELPCTEKATIYTANGAAAYIGATCRNIITKEPVHKIQLVDFKASRTVNV
jgi:hypothetical protein